MIKCGLLYIIRSSLKKDKIVNRGVTGQSRLFGERRFTLT